MKVAGSIALVTGANRGLGLPFAKALLERGAAKVYAAARNPKAVTLKGVVPLKLDVTSDEDVIAAARVAGNVNLLVNNAGIARPGSFLADGAVEAAREQFEVKFVGPLRMVRAFAPVLAKNGGGAIINVLSVASWMNGPGLATYGASKSAEWALTNGLRIELAQQGTQVVGLHAGFIDTDLTQSTRRRVRPRKEEVLGERHPSVLANRYLRSVVLNADVLSRCSGFKAGTRPSFSAADVAASRSCGQWARQPSRNRRTAARRRHSSSAGGSRPTRSASVLGMPMTRIVKCSARMRASPGASAPRST
jgi:NAD(P)-dependent dehydrogenase (short-subunit alcohol dehydrogenase family)